jgi:hypothetical protein
VNVLTAVAPSGSATVKVTTDVPVTPAFGLTLNDPEEEGVISNPAVTCGAVTFGIRSGLDEVAATTRPFGVSRSVAS